VSPAEPGASGAAVASLHYYPVKACAATDLTAADVQPRGIVGDRTFAVVDADGETLTQRKHPVLATVRPRWADGRLALAQTHQGGLVLTARTDGPVVPVTVHGRPCGGIDQGQEAADWFAGVVGGPCRLMFCPPGAGKAVNPDYGQGETAYADGYPVTVISLASLRRLDTEIAAMGEAPVPMTRFRPSIVVDGWTDAHHEDTVRVLRVGAAEVELVKRDDRCTVTTVDQSTGERTRQPLRALGRYRLIDQKLMFGMFGLVRRTGTVHVGDPVEILA
jgi:uncharacterized protein YcbX